MLRLMLSHLFSQLLENIDTTGWVTTGNLMPNDTEMPAPTINATLTTIAGEKVEGAKEAFLGQYFAAHLYYFCAVLQQCTFREAYAWRWVIVNRAWRETIYSIAGSRRHRISISLPWSTIPELKRIRFLERTH